MANFKGFIPPKKCPSIAFVCNNTIHGGNIHLVLDISDFTASVMMLTKLCLRSSNHKSLLQPGGRGNIVVGSRQDSPQDQDPHRQGLETLPLTYSPLLSSDPPPAWPRPPPPSPPTQPPRPPVCVCHRVSEVAQVAPRPLSREAPAIWVTVPASENKGASGRGRGEKGESICLTVWRQSMLTSQQLRCTDWLCMSAIPSSQSEEWVG